MRVGPWRIVDLRGGGAYGTVYLAEGAEGYVALKVARTPREPRFAREVALLSRLDHPAIPRLISHGQWESPAGLPHPYLVMQWLEGLPLYEWARFRLPTSRQVLRVLADLARALDATHAATGVHRDVKGENVLVRVEDGQAFLIDFGSASYHGADTLTWQVFPPGTPAYRSPEAIAFAVNILRSPVKQYIARPADDVFALGVTAYRLVTGQYPPTADPNDEGAHVWQEGGTGPQPAHELNERCVPALSGIISWMLSRQPEARGGAHELAEALELAATEAGPEADAPLFLRDAPPPVDVPADAVEPTGRDAEPEAEAPLFTQEVPPRVDVEVTVTEEEGDSPVRGRPPMEPWEGALLFPAVLAASVALAVIWGVQAVRAYFSAQEEARDAGTVSVGDEALMAPEVPAEPSALSPIAQKMPSTPLPGQLRPDANGRCPYKSLVAINGGCWTKVSDGLKDCRENSFVHQGACYMPVMDITRPGTSAPVEARDGG